MGPEEIHDLVRYRLGLQIFVHEVLNGCRNVWLHVQGLMLVQLLDAVAQVMLRHFPKLLVLRFGLRQFPTVRRHHAIQVPVDAFLAFLGSCVVEETLVGDLDVHLGVHLQSATRPVVAAQL